MIKNRSLFPDKSLGYVYRGDNHGWLFGWKNGFVFQAGPATAMNWYGTSGTGSHSAAGNRSTDPDSMCGNAVMYDAVGGKILTVGGAPAYVSKSTSSYHPNYLARVLARNSNTSIFLDRHVSYSPYPIPYDAQFGNFLIYRHLWHS